MLALLLGEYFYLQLAIRDSSIVRRAIRELKIMEDINVVEFLKRSQKPSIEFSFYRAYDFLGKKGGFFDLTPISSLDCIPYWQIYDTKNTPDIKQNIEMASASMFNRYMNEFVRYGASIPAYGVTIQNVQPQTLDIQANAGSDLELNFDRVKVIEKTNFNHQVPIGLFHEYDIAKVNLIDANVIRNAVNDGINSAGLSSSGSKTNRAACPSACPSEDEVFQEINGMTIFDGENLLKTKISEKITDLKNNLNTILAGTNIQVNFDSIETDSQITPSCSDDLTAESCDAVNYYCKKTCDFAFVGVANVLVSVENTTMKYLIGNEPKTAPLKFRIVDGTQTIVPNTNVCTETI
jgi:hypothetical protein